MTSMGENKTTTLLNATDIRQLAHTMQIVPTKNLGQNFVIDGNTIRKIVKLAKLQTQQTVLEIGPGLGSLTLALLAETKQVVALEIDPKLAKNLPNTINSYAPQLTQNLHVIETDVLKIHTLPKNPTVLVANLPYNIAVLAILHALEFFTTIERGIVMVQLEVAQRLCAQAGSKDYGVPSVKLAWWGKASKVAVIGKNVFWPAPKVSSALVVFERTPPINTHSTKEQVFAVIDAAFAQRRKTLRSALANWAGNATVAEKILQHANIDPTLRGERLDIKDFVKIAETRTNFLV